MDRSREMKPEGHQALLIFNQSRLLETVVAGQWMSTYIGGRAGLPGGVYDLTGAERPGKNATSGAYQGNVLHVDERHVYQLQANALGKSHVVRHDLALFKEAPVVGSVTKVDYVRGIGQVANREQFLER
jgi:hypothetical protein